MRQKKRTRWMLLVIIIVSILSLCYLGAMGFAWLFAEKLVFPVHRMGGSAYQDDETILKLTTQDGLRISARYYENELSEHVLLYSHGNFEDIGRIHAYITWLETQGFSVLVYDYPGYGTSEGQPTEQSSYAAIEAAYAYLREVKGYAPEKIIAYGRSVGGGPTLELALRQPLGGVVLEGAFTSIFRIPFNYSIFPWDHFDNLGKIGRLRCPLLVIHGRLDRTVPFWHGRKLYEAAPEPKQALWVDNAGHNDAVTLAGPRFRDALDIFKQTVQSEALRE